MSTDFVIETSIVMKWYFRDATSQYADRILDRLETGTGLVPSIWPLEVCNVLLTAERKKRRARADSARFIALLNELPIIVEQEPPERMMREIFALAREHHLSSYDASYMDLAMRKGLPLATLDKNLLAAAELSGVTIYDAKRTGGYPVVTRALGADGVWPYGGLTITGAQNQFSGMANVVSWGCPLA